MMQDIFFEWSPFDFTFHYLYGIFFKMQLFVITLTPCPVFGTIIFISDNVLTDLINQGCQYLFTQIYRRDT
jgi:hypothetical protein